MTHATKPHRKLQPARGHFTFILKPDSLGNAVLRINETLYLLSAIRQDKDACKKRFIHDRPIIGWTLTKSDGTTYNVQFTEEVPSCDCPDYVVREYAQTMQERCCKHLNCLRVALPLVGLPLTEVGPDGKPLVEAIEESAEVA